MPEDQLSLSERLKVWEATGMSIVLKPEQVKELRSNLDDVVGVCVKHAETGIAERKRAALFMKWSFVAFGLTWLAILIDWLVQ